MNYTEFLKQELAEARQAFVARTLELEADISISYDIIYGTLFNKKGNKLRRELGIKPDSGSIMQALDATAQQELVDVMSLAVKLSDAGNFPLSFSYTSCWYALVSDAAIRMRNRRQADAVGPYIEELLMDAMEAEG